MKAFRPASIHWQAIKIDTSYHVRGRMKQMTTEYAWRRHAFLPWRASAEIVAIPLGLAIVGEVISIPCKGHTVMTSTDAIVERTAEARVSPPRDRRASRPSNMAQDMAASMFMILAASCREAEYFAQTMALRPADVLSRPSTSAR